MIIKIQCFVEADCNFENMKQFTAGLHGWYRFVIFHWMCRTNCPSYCCCIGM